MIISTGRSTMGQRPRRLRVGEWLAPARGREDPTRTWRRQVPSGGNVGSSRVVFRPAVQSRTETMLTAPCIPSQATREEMFL